MRTLLEAICADETNDDPRLVYADALMQSGDEVTYARGEFIVIQCKLAQTDCLPVERKTLKARERALLEAYKKSWLATLYLTAKEREHVNFHRGFIDRITMPLTLFVKIAPALAMNPRLFLNVTDVEKNFEPLRSEAMLRVKHLMLNSCNISDEGAKAMAQSKYLQNITHLDLRYNRIRNEGAVAMAQSEYLQNLTTLLLWGNRISDEGAVAIAQSEYLRNLTHLDLRYNSIGNEGAAAIAQSEYLRNLQHLNLSGDGIGNEGAAAIAQSEHLQSLTHLGLSSNYISDEGAKAIAQSKYLRKLTHLGLSTNNISDEGAALLRKRWPFVEI